jgi:uncharacterized membrane protein YgcG
MTLPITVPSPVRRPRAHRARRGATALAIAAVAVALAAVGVLAVDALPRLQDRVTDQVDVLTPAEEEAVLEALERLEDEHDLQLFVAFVETTGVDTITDFTEGTAEASSLGGNDALLLVAVGDRSDALWVGDALDEVSDAEIDAILGEVVEPRLSDGDFAGAVTAGAEALGDASAAGEVLPTLPPDAEPAPAPDEGAATGGGGINITAILAVVLLVGGAILLARALLERRARAKEAKAAHASLSSRANRALLATDEALKDAANDVEFAAAQWGEPEVVAYREAIATAAAELKAAFAVRQRLDDAEPDTPAEQDAMLKEIVERTTKAQALLDEQEARFDALRDLEEAAPAQLDALLPTIEALRGRREAAAREQERIAAAYAPSAVASVAGNAAEAEKALASAFAETERGRGLVATRRSDAVVALRRAQDGVARATHLVEAIERLGARLDEAAERLPTELEAAAADVAAARRGVEDGRTLPPLAPGTSLVPPTAPGVSAGPAIADPQAALANAERLLGEARRAAEARPLDPLAALERATAANTAADAIIAGLREARAQRERRQQAAVSAITGARGSVQRAIDYITTRRHGVGREARTRAAEAELRLGEAERLATTDPEGAIAAAQRASRLADEAYRLAASEFDGWDQGGGPVAGPYRPGGYGRGGSEAEVIGAVLGGILGGVLTGAGRGGRGAGWGGTPWGGSVGGSSRGGGFGFPGGGGGIGLPGPFGGGGGGGLGGLGGGGGGRVRGGRW